MWTKKLIIQLILLLSESYTIFLTHFWHIDNQYSTRGGILILKWISFSVSQVLQLLLPFDSVHLHSPARTQPVTQGLLVWTQLCILGQIHPPDKELSVLQGLLTHRSAS